MLSNELKKYIQSVDKKDHKSRIRRTHYKLFLDIAITLPKMRKSRGITQRELAKKIGTSHPTIARWETAGYSGYTLSKLIEVADALDYKLDLRFIPKHATVTYDNNITSEAWPITEGLHERDPKLLFGPISKNVKCMEVN